MALQFFISELIFPHLNQHQQHYQDRLETMSIPAAWTRGNIMRRLSTILVLFGFFIGSFLAWFGFARDSIVKTVFVCAGLFTLGGVLETCQLLTASRYFNFIDVIANGVGILLFLLCLPFISRLVK